MKEEFDSIELIEKSNSWNVDKSINKYTAKNDTASIFIIYEHGNYKRLGFKKGHQFLIKDDFIIYELNLLIEFCQC